MKNGDYDSDKKMKKYRKTNSGA